MNKPVASGSGIRRGRVPEPHFLIVARVRKSFGLRGDLKLHVLTDHPEKLAGTVYVGETLAPYQVERLWQRADDWLLKLKGCDDRTQADALQGQAIHINLQDAAPLEPNVYYHHQLIGLRVVTLEGQELGVLDEILVTGANDVYVVHGPRGEVLLPARVEVIRQVDLERGVMAVQLLPGLLP